MSHFIRYGSCGHVIAQCRCPSPDKNVEHVKEVCDKCNKPEEDTMKNANYSGAVSRAYAEQIIEQRDNLRTELYATRKELADARKSYDDMRTSRDKWMGPYCDAMGILESDHSTNESLVAAARRVVAERNEATVALQSLHAEFESLSVERDDLVRSRDRWISKYQELQEILGAGDVVCGRDLPEDTIEAALRVVAERDKLLVHFDDAFERAARFMEERDQLKAKLAAMEHERNEIARVCGTVNAQLIEANAKLTAKDELRDAAVEFTEATLDNRALTEEMLRDAINGECGIVDTYREAREGLRYLTAKAAVDKNGDV